VCKVKLSLPAVYPSGIFLVLKHVRKPPLQTSRGVGQDKVEKACAFAKHTKMFLRRNHQKSRTNSNHQSNISKELKFKKSSGCDLITSKISHPLFNAVLIKGYFPAQQKVAQVILILKPGKPNEITSYQPKRLLRMVEDNGFIPNHQFTSDRGTLQ
jgi:hypothetical protein